MELVTKSLKQLKSQSGNEESTLGQPRLEALPMIQLTGQREDKDERSKEEEWRVPEDQEKNKTESRRDNREAGPWKKGLSGRT